MNRIYFGDNLPILQKMPSGSVDLIYIDPPFNTGKTQKRTTIRTIRSENGDRKGFQGNHYQTIELGTKAFRDSFPSYIVYIDGFLKPRLEEAYRLLTPHGSLYFHIDYREAHYCKVLLDKIFGRDCFLNEIIWAYDYGGRSKSKWPTKHDNILFYAKDKTQYIFNKDEIDREPYMAPGLVGPEKAKRKKLPTDTWWPQYTGVKNVTDTWWLPNVGIGQTDTWWQTIVPTNSKERIGYPTQKPRRLIDRIVKASSHPGSTVLDFFAGSGTVGESCLELERNFILIDINQEALEVMARRFSNVGNIEWVNFDPTPYQTRSDNGQTNSQESRAFPISLDFIMLAASASHLRDELQGESEEIDNLWKNSPFGWVLQLSAAKKGKLARQLVSIWCQRRGLSVGYTRGSNPLMVNERQIAIKMSTLWADGKYKFQQIRDKGYDYVVCLGISPFELHCWIFEREYAIKNATPQHKSATGAEYWIAINPNKIDDWAKKCGGTLDQAYLVLKELKRK